jgi:hypothetical protein
MAGSANLNSIISQGMAIKEIYNAKKQSLELQQHFNAQHTEVKKEKERPKIKKFSTGNAIEDRKEPRKRQRRSGSRNRKREKESRQDSKELKKEGNFIDIKV